MCIHTSIHLRASEDNLKELILSLQDGTQVMRLGSKCIIAAGPEVILHILSNYVHWTAACRVRTGVEFSTRGIPGGVCASRFYGNKLSSQAAGIHPPVPAVPIQPGNKPCLCLSFLACKMRQQSQRLFLTVLAKAEVLILWVEAPLGVE